MTLIWSPGLSWPSTFDNLMNVVYAIDLDRTLLRTELAFEHLVTLCREASIADTEMLQTAKRASDSSAGLFDVMSYLARQDVGEDILTQLCQTFGTQPNGQQLLYKDATPFLQSVADRCLIITTGGTEWQLAKLRAVRLDRYPYLITPADKKSVLISRWRSEGRYRIPTSNGEVLEAQKVVLVDDKAVSFEGLPQDCTGYWLRRGAVLLDSQAGEVPEQVTTVSSLAEIPV